MESLNIKSIQDLDTNPMVEFKRWFLMAKEKKLPQYNAMTLATVSEEGKPSARMILLKQYNEQGFCFYTNYNSRKGKELEKNPFAALVFYWESLGGQIRIEGRTSKISNDISTEYFASRPYDSQINACVSRQSELLESREKFDQEIIAYKNSLKGKLPGRPEHWGGYILAPFSIEFWVNGVNRAHQRYLYRRESDQWSLQQLYP